MELNLSKCQVVRVTTSRNPVNMYSVQMTWPGLGGCHVQSTCGVGFSSGLSWNTNIDRITGNVIQTINFVKRNITTKNLTVRETAYNALVRPRLESAAPMWDPPPSTHTHTHIPNIKYFSQKKSKGGLYAGLCVTMIIGQALQPCLNSLLGGLLNKDEQMRVYVFSSKKR